MTDEARDPRDPFAPPDALGSYPPPTYPPPAQPTGSYPPPTGAPLPAPPWSGDPYSLTGPPQQPRRGRGWLVAGVVAGGVALLAVAGFAAVQVLGGALDSLAAGPEGADGVWISDVTPGACYVLDDADRREDVAGYVTIIGCQFKHDGQVYAVVPLDYASWPGQRALNDAAADACREKDALLDDAVFDEAGLSGSWYLPYEGDWDVEPHTVQCVVESDGALGLDRSWLQGGASASPESV